MNCLWCFPSGSDGKASVCNAGPWVGKILWRRRWQPTPVFLPGKSHGPWSKMNCLRLWYKMRIWDKNKFKRDRA